MPRRPETFSLCNLVLTFRAAPLSSGRIVSRVAIEIVMVIGKGKCYDFYGHPTSISDHKIIGLIEVWYIDITEDIVAFAC